MRKLSLKTNVGEFIKLHFETEEEMIAIIQNKHKYKAPNYFEALLLLREELEKENILLLCNGCRFDVYPSRMTIQMSQGKKAYLLTLGKGTSDNDIVNIFDSAPLGKVGTINTQKEYYKKWIKSLRKL